MSKASRVLRLAACAALATGAVVSVGGPSARAEPFVYTLAEKIGFPIIPGFYKLGETREIRLSEMYKLGHWKSDNAPRSSEAPWCNVSYARGCYEPRKLPCTAGSVGCTNPAGTPCTGASPGECQKADGFPCDDFDPAACEKKLGRTNDEFFADWVDPYKGVLTYVMPTDKIQRSVMSIPLPDLKVGESITAAYVWEWSNNLTQKYNEGSGPANPRDAETWKPLSAIAYTHLVVSDSPTGTTGQVVSGWQGKYFSPWKEHHQVATERVAFKSTRQGAQYLNVVAVSNMETAGATCRMRFMGGGVVGSPGRTLAVKRGYARLQGAQIPCRLIADVGQANMHVMRHRSTPFAVTNADNVQVTDDVDDDEYTTLSASRPSAKFDHVTYQNLGRSSVEWTHEWDVLPAASPFPENVPPVQDSRPRIPVMSVPVFLKKGAAVTLEADAVLPGNMLAALDNLDDNVTSTCAQEFNGQLLLMETPNLPYKDLDWNVTRELNHSSSFNLSEGMPRWTMEQTGQVSLGGEDIDRLGWADRTVYVTFYAADAYCGSPHAIALEQGSMIVVKHTHVSTGGMTVAVRNAPPRAESILPIDGYRVLSSVDVPSCKGGLGRAFATQLVSTHGEAGYYAQHLRADVPDPYSWMGLWRSMDMGPLHGSDAPGSTYGPEWALGPLYGAMAVTGDLSFWSSGTVRVVNEGVSFEGPMTAYDGNSAQMSTITYDTATNGACLVTSQAGGPERHGWYDNQPSLAAPKVSGNVRMRWDATLDLTPGESVLAQPLVWNDRLLIVTEANDIYLLATGGAAPLALAKRSLAAEGEQPTTASAAGCSDVAPTVGITGTPVIDNETGTAYFFAKSGVSGWRLHAVDLQSSTLAERPGFPVAIRGAAQNNAGITFNAAAQLQRPGLLLMNGVVYGAFGGHCKKSPYTGWIFGVTAYDPGVASGGTIVTRFATVSSVPRDGGGIWMPGGGLVSDGDGSLLFTTGNAANVGGQAYPKPLPGTSPPADLVQAVVRARVQPDRSLKAVDFFAPASAASLNTNNLDLGPVVSLPREIGQGTTSPNLAVAAGRAGMLYLLDRDALGGHRQGSGGGDKVLGASPLSGGTWSRPAAWSSASGGYVYVTVNGPATGGAPPKGLEAYQIVKVGTAPTLKKVASSSESFGAFSGSPIITSDGLDPASGVVWVTNSSGQLLAYRAVPVSGGRLELLSTWNIGVNAKLSSPGVGQNRVFVGTATGHVLAFGAP